MTYDEAIIELRYEAARLKIGKVNGDRIINLINALLDAGVYFDEFLDVLNHSSFRPNFISSVERA